MGLLRRRSNAASENPIPCTIENSCDRLYHAGLQFGSSVVIAKIEKREHRVAAKKLLIEWNNRLAEALTLRAQADTVEIRE